MRIAVISIIAVIAIFLASITSCDPIGSVVYSVGQEPFQNLSQYRFYTGKISDLLPNSRVLPYDLNSALFSDYAFKKRFVWVPEGHSAEFKEKSAFKFPVGSILIKNFYYPENFSQAEGKKRIMETRLLIHEKNGWVALPYIWNDEQTEAKLSLAGGNSEVSWIHYDGEIKKINYSIPDKNQCKNCHQSGDDLIPIGPKAKNLNRDIEYEEGKLNQLTKWVESGILKPFDWEHTEQTLVDYSDPDKELSDRAIAYLEINCGHCHNPEGSAHTSGLNLIQEETRPANLGICKSPISAGKGTGGYDYDIYPGKADSSILLFRMISNDPSIMMPEIGRKIAHDEGVALIRDWINSMPGSCD